MLHVGHTRFRGSVKQAFLMQLQEERAKIVTLIHDVSFLVDDKYRAILKSKWDSENPGQDAAKKGHLVRTIPIKGVGLPHCTRSVRRSVTHDA